MTSFLHLEVPLEARRLWEPGNPHLYDIQIELVDETDTVLDSVSSYAGLRSVSIQGSKVLINGKAVFQRLVLDQGYYPDGLLTAPSDDDLINDIKLSMDAGFNGARLHQKVFEERFLYHADRHGYLVWGEFPDWGLFQDNGYGSSRAVPAAAMTAEWMEVLERDYSHPSIIGWCPLNETKQPWTDDIVALDDITRALYLATKAVDPTRPVLDASGYAHRIPGADIYDSHDYTQDPALLRKRHAGLAEQAPYVNVINKEGVSVPYRGQPYFVSEFGGIWWNSNGTENEKSWGYGERPKSIEAFYVRFEGLCHVLLDNPNMFGYCYTQLTDVFQEQNGIYGFDRRPKFDIERIRKVQEKAAGIEGGPS